MGETTPATSLGRVTALVGAVLFLDSVFYAAIVPILGRLSRQFALSPDHAGLLVGAFAAGTLMGAYPGALLTARWGPQRAVLAGLAGLACGCLLFAFTGSAVGLETGRLLQGFASACSWCGGLAWLAQSSLPGQLGRALGTALGFGVFGAQAGPAVGALAAGIGRGAAFASAAFFAAVLAICARVVRPQALSRPPTASVRDLRGRDFAGGLWLTLLPSAGLGALDVLAPLRLSALGASPLRIGATFFVAAGLLSVVSYLTGRTADRIGVRTPTRLAAGASVLALVVLSRITGEFALSVLVVLVSACLGALWIPSMRVLSAAAERRGVHHGYAFGGFTFAWALGYALGSSSAGALSTAGGEALPYLLLAGAYVVTLVCVLPVRPNARRSTSDSSRP